ncbi:MAG: hypothetical protein WCI73_10320, partial [Phycisphaerae bacterium]
MLDDALAALFQARKDNPRCDMAAAEMAAQEGRRRPHAVFYLGRGPDPDADDAMRVSSQQRQPQSEHYDLAKLEAEVRGLTGPLAMGNPFRCALGLGVGPGTLTASFGCTLDPNANFCPGNHVTLDELLARGAPDPATSGLLPVMHEKIDLIKQHTPAWLKIDQPDMQGPFNLAHMILGDEAFFAPLERPAEFHQAMTLITDFFLAVHANVLRWISPERMDWFLPRIYRIAECSTNMISAELYTQHVLPHDLRIAQTWGKVGIHTCSGPHVFTGTLRQLPNLIATEAGHIAKATAGWTDPD